jgi:putative NADH-flavin reductase
MTDLPVLVLGASGRTGRPLVEQALAAGHRVRAFVRTPSKLGLTHERLEFVQGDVLDPQRLARAVSGSSAVLSTLGRDGRDVRPIVDGTRSLIGAMRGAGVRRLVCMSSMGAGSTAAHAGLALKAIIALSGLAPSFQAKAVQEAELHASGLDVTLLFAGGLTNGPHTGRQRVTRVDEVGRVFLMPPRISRADVADGMLTELRVGTWRGQSVCVFG